MTEHTESTEKRRVVVVVETVAITEPGNVEASA